MKKLVLSITAVAVMGALLSTCTEATAQSAKPHKIGLVDMAFIFKNYKKFKAERETIENDLKMAAEGAKKQREDIEKLQETLKGLTPTSPEFSIQEKKVASAVASFQADASRIKRELVMKEAELYKRTYLEVTDIIGKYAQYQQYTLILRYSQETVKADDGPQEVMQKMSNQVVYRQPSDDITQAVLEFMNKEYEKTAGGAARPRQ